MKNKHFKLDKVEKLPNSEAQITGEITLPFLVECRKEAVKLVGKNADISGFRSGHIPEDVLAKHYGEMRILEEAAELALGREYAGIMKEADISPISRPEISITKMAPGVPLEFKIKVAVEPEFKLPDYKKAAAEAGKRSDPEEVSDKEIEDTLAEIEKRGIKPDLKKGEDLKEKVKESILEQKKLQAQEKRRLAILDNLVGKTEIALPKALVEAELEKMLAQFRGDVERMGMQPASTRGGEPTRGGWPDYLKQAKKTEEEVKKEWQEQAEKRVKAELILAKIAVEEKIEPSPEEVEAEVKHLLSHYPDADALRAKIYIYSQLRNKKVFEYLENLG